MRKSMTSMIAFALGLIGAMAMGGNPASAQGGPPPTQQSACYEWDIFPNSPIRYVARRKGNLTTRAELQEFGHPRQRVFEAEGKGVNPCGPNTMAVLDGGVVVARPGAELDGGAHLGIEIYVVRGDGELGGDDFCRPYHFDCTSPEASPTPDRWSCQSRNEFDVYHGISTLRRVNPLQQRLCSIFENGTFEEPGPQALGADGVSVEPGPGNPAPAE